jgi:hypothetical protein
MAYCKTLCRPSCKRAALFPALPAPAHLFVPLPPIQVYEVKKDEIDGALDKGRSQFTTVYDKHVHKVSAGWGGTWCTMVLGGIIWPFYVGISQLLCHPLVPCSMLP